LIINTINCSLKHFNSGHRNKAGASSMIFNGNHTAASAHLVPMSRTKKCFCEQSIVSIFNAITYLPHMKGNNQSNALFKTFQTGKMYWWCSKKAINVYFKYFYQDSSFIDLISNLQIFLKFFKHGLLFFNQISVILSLFVFLLKL